MPSPSHFPRAQLLQRWPECMWAHCLSVQRVEELVFPALGIRHLHAGESLWRAGEKPMAWVGVFGGAVKLCVQLADGRAVTVCSAAGSWVGEAALLHGLPSHGCDAVALHDLTAVYLPRACFDTLCASEPAFVRFLLRLMAERNQQLMELLVAHQQAVPVNRVAHSLGALITPMNFPSPQGMWLNVPQSELADFCQVSRSRLNEALAELHRQGLVAVGYRSVQILDLEGLRTFESGKLHACAGARA